MELMLGLLPPPQVEIPPKLVALADEVIDETLITLFGGGARVAARGVRSNLKRPFAKSLWSVMERLSRCRGHRTSHVGRRSTFANIRLSRPRAYLANLVLARQKRASARKPG